MCGAARLFVVLLAVAPLSTVEAQVVVPSLLTQGSAERPWTLEEAVTAALSQHPLVEAAQARVDAARGERAGAAALPNPITTLMVENAGYPGQPGSSDLTQETSLYLAYPLEWLFQRGPRVRRAEQDVSTAQALLLLARRMVAAETVQSFFSVALAEALQDEAAENRDRLEQLVAYNRVRVEAGMAAEGELLRLEVELDSSRNDVVIAGVELMRQRARLVPYTGAYRGDARIASIRTAVPVSDEVAIDVLPALDAALAMARARRPEVAVSRARAGAANASIAFERSLAVRQTGATFGNKRAGGQNSMIAGLSFTIPLFNVNGGAVSRATSERLAAEHELAWAERLVAADLQAAHASATQLTAQLNELRQKFLARASDVHKLTLGAYQEGGATLLQVLDATRMLADARLTYSRTLFAQRESLFRLALAVGSEPLDAFDALHAWSTAPSSAGRVGDRP
jgi:cobalt-zinc-cadmium efflux system outer membrane protein